MPVFSTFKDISLALARVSIFCVPLVIVNGPNVELADVSFGKSFKFNVTFLLVPSIIILQIFIPLNYFHN